jgi:hypothetical protein
MIKKILQFLLLVLIISNNQSAQALDTLTSFQTTVQKLEVSKDGGQTFITIFENNTQPIDLTNLSGQNLGSFLGSAIVPAGTYNRARVTVSTATVTFTVDGTGATNATNLNANTTGTLTDDLTARATFPIMQTLSINVTMTTGGTTNAVIDFDAATSATNLAYSDDDAGGAGVAVTFGGITVNPQIKVSE